MENYFEKIMNEEQGLKIYSVVNTRVMDLAFNPIGRADCAPDKNNSRTR
jgi:hypothetical protein